MWVMKVSLLKYNITAVFWNKEENKDVTVKNNTFLF